MIEKNNRTEIADRRAVEPQAKLLPTTQRSEGERRQDTPEGALTIVVVESGHLSYGLVVDGMFDSEEIVVKPLGRHMKNSSCLAGATILGNGRVALIVDIAGIASRCQLVIPNDAGKNQASKLVKDDLDERQAALLFKNDPDEFFVVPMPLVSRIERVRVEQIDSVGGQEVLQYRGTSLPLLSLERYINAKPRPDRPWIHVVVFRAIRQEVGLIAPELMDIREVTVDIDMGMFREPGVLGSIVLDGNTARVLDLLDLAQSAHPEWFPNVGNSAQLKQAKARILLAEDSPFFRSQVQQFLLADGYEVEACEDGLAAWNILQASVERFDAVVTDIQMPNLDGFQLTEKIRSDSQFANLPVIALTSLTGDEDIARGKEVGLSEYLVKLDRDLLVNALTKHLGARPEGQSHRVFANPEV